MASADNIHFYRVAGFLFGVALADGFSRAEGASLPGYAVIDRLLPSFVPFRAVPEEGEKPLFVADVAASAEPAVGTASREAVVLEETSNDMGRATLFADGDRYTVELTSRPGAAACVMTADRRFESVVISADMADVFAGQALSSMLRIACSQAVLPHGAVSIHASAVLCGGRAYLFTGRSGIGKSTHSSLWLRTVPGATLLNDDNPFLRIENGRAVAFGTPWSGKTPCYRNEKAPVAGLVRLRQASENRFVPKSDVEAFSVLLPGCSAIRKDRRLYDCLCDTLVEMSEMIPVGILECRPDADAVAVCRKGLGLPEEPCGACAGNAGDLD